MNSTRMFHMIGSWSFMLLGIGHLATYFLLPITPEQEHMMHKMKNFAISMPGPDSNLLLFHEGFSLMMGMLLIGYGAINVFLMAEQSFDLPKSKFIPPLNLFVSLVAVVLSIAYFFIVPVVFTTISFFAFGWVYALTR